MCVTINALDGGWGGLDLLGFPLGMLHFHIIEMLHHLIEEEQRIKSQRLGLHTYGSATTIRAMVVM